MNFMIIKVKYQLLVHLRGKSTADVANEMMNFKNVIVRVDKMARYVFHSRCHYFPIHKGI